MNSAIAAQLGTPTKIQGYSTGGR